MGANITLAAAATGTGPLSYQWQHQGTNLASGTTNTLSLLNVQTDDAGAYRVVITNVAGATTSSVVSVTVIIALNRHAADECDCDRWSTRLIRR